jgi:hypothetical protein
MNLKGYFLILLFLFSIAGDLFSAEKIIISEFMAANGHGLQDEDKACSDWIEIQNTGETAISLKGVYLTDNPLNLTKWKFPDVKLDAGKFLIVFASEKNRTDPTKTLHTNFKLSGSGEFLALVSTDGKTLLSAFTPQYPVQEEDISYGYYNGQTVYFDQPTPGAANVQSNKVQTPVFSKARGYYSTPFEVTLQTPDDGAQIYYTTDGVRPTPQNGILYKEPIKINTTTPLSAITVKNGTETSTVVSNTYFFTDSILKQNNHPKGYPSEWGTFVDIPGIAPADYEMDPEICEDPTYKTQLVDAFQDLPSVSVVTDPDNLFSHSTDAKTGGIYIYTCPSGKGIGEGWERPASIEYFDPKTNEWFQVNCALQLHGGASRVPEKTPKHSFRLEFKTEYGPSKLDYPLFSDPEATTQFNSLVLRANFGYTWLHWNPAERKAPKYVQDSWGKDMQQAMGHHAAHNKFVHLFLNGMYWGMYNISERLDEDFMGTYLKGKSDDFDVIKDYAEVVSGNLTAWNNMMAMANSGLSTQAAYQKIQGNNPDGTRNTAYEPYLNVDNLIDYMLLNFYAGNNDWDHHNWVAARNKVEPGKGFKFFSWDAEHLFTSSTIDVTKEDNANCPSHLFTKLKDNADFRLRVADRVQQLFFSNGLLTPQSAADYYLKRANEIEKAILCESARWGDYRRDVQPRDNDNDLYTPEKYWVKTLNWLTQTYFPPRTALVVNQLRLSGLYPYVDAPVFSDNGGSITSELDLEMSAKIGTIYYTVDGTDPRTSGGSIAPNGILSYNSPLKIKGNGTVKARVKDGANWSALTEATFVFPDSTLVLTAGFGTKAGNGNFPNPFASETNIFFNLDKASQVKISVLNVQGKLVDILFEGKLAAGTQYKKWKPRGIEKGIYLYQVQTEEKTISGKMVYLK